MDLRSPPSRKRTSSSLGGGNSKSNTGVSNGSTGGQPSDPANMEPLQQSVDLSGRVILSSGGAPPEPVRIKRV